MFTNWGQLATFWGNLWFFLIQPCKDCSHKRNYNWLKKLILSYSMKFSTGLRNEVWYFVAFLCYFFPKVEGGSWPLPCKVFFYNFDDGWQSFTVSQILDKIKQQNNCWPSFSFVFCQNLQKENGAKYPTSLHQSEEGQWKLCLCLYFGIQIIVNCNLTQVTYLIFHM